VTADAALGGLWLVVLLVGLGIAVALRRAGLASTYVRDLVHVGAGVWVLGWPLWRGALVPVAIPAAATVGAVLASRARRGLLARVRGAMTGRDERWSGVALYVASYAAFTALGFGVSPFPAGGALLALSLGDGIGGAVGRKYGRTLFAAPGGKTKSLEGTATVAAMSAVGVALAALALGAPLRAGVVAGAGVVAAIAEAIAPRGTDNAVLPAAVWILLTAC
jgi:dolichol kinase